MQSVIPVDVPAPSMQLLELAKALQAAEERWEQARARRDQVAGAMQAAANGLAQLNRERQISPLTAPALIARHEDKVATLREQELEARAGIRAAQRAVEQAAIEVDERALAFSATLHDEIDGPIAEQAAIMERAAAEMMRAMHAAIELGWVIGRGRGAGVASIMHPFPTPEEPHKNLAVRPIGIDGVVAPWRGFRPLLQNARRSWEDLPPKAAAE
jgi:ribosomal protein L7/L12